MTSRRRRRSERASRRPGRSILTARPGPSRRSSTSSGKITDARWRVVVSPRAKRDLRRLEPRLRERVTDRLAALTYFPSLGDLKKLNDAPNEWRLRVGDIRVRFSPDHEARVIAVLSVLPRDKAYRD
ncbi:MAG: hypothetical protein FJ319_02405 [SAR202 cluster bacterium]|nr:hypothetical protein [SAR202 cluster bacterium]